MHQATVCIPWRPQPDRLAAHTRVREFWRHHGFTVVEADSARAKPFSRSRARNNAVRKATTDVVIVADADTIPEPAVICEAVALAEKDCVIYPFTEYVCVPASAVKADLTMVEPERIWLDSPGGIVVTNTTTYWKLGGSDERFERCWGFDDTAFYAAAQTLSRVIRLPGTVWSFQHGVDGGRDPSEENPNYWRNELYTFATGRPEIMRELIKR